ncbi:ABC transporter ATP-binding protein [Agathobaculum desmolans]|uniref:ABC transporter ATP-binding protein n=1 Tax=Agathobaculum desmolans TaxID=39484 RepID=UPI000A555E17|nr:ABC transporter ATP-binding protein [Agathobaculum desmolans]
MIDVNNVSMRFNLATEKTESLKEYVVKLLTGKLMFDEFYALKNVSFHVDRGESVGILGANGSGKSTLLKVISGIYPPSSGTVSVNGAIAPLIELGAGFDPDLTARENVYLNGAVMGFQKEFVEDRYDEIVAFSELANFMDVPIKNFSSGMTARLGFSIATLVHPDILIVDEVLGVGDAAFQKKCESKMDELRQNGTTMLFVSHSVEQVEKVCTKAIWLKRGELVMSGTSKKVCAAYDEWGKTHSAFE